MLPMRAKWKQAMAVNGNENTSLSTKIDVGQCMTTTRTVKSESSYTKLSNIVKLVERSVKEELGAITAI